MNAKLLFLAALLGVAASWDTSWDKEFTYTCPSNQHLYRIKSKHDNGKEDRVWSFYCRNSGAVKTSGCSWTNYLNSMDNVVNYKCPSNKILTGINSYHSNGPEDRRWKARCCDAATPLSGCSWSGYWNNWDGWMDGSINNNQVMTGMYSYHSNSKKTDDSNTMSATRRLSMVTGPATEDTEAARRTAEEEPRPGIEPALIQHH